MSKRGNNRFEKIRKKACPYSCLTVFLSTSTAQGKSVGGRGVDPQGRAKKGDNRSLRDITVRPSSASKERRAGSDWPWVKRKGTVRYRKTPNT